MNMHVYFYFLSFIHYDIRDENFYLTDKIEYHFNSLPNDLKPALGDIYAAVVNPISYDDDSSLHKRMALILKYCLTTKAKDLNHVADTIYRNYINQIYTYHTFSKLISKDFILHLPMYETTPTSETVAYFHTYNTLSINDIFKNLDTISGFGYNDGYISSYVRNLQQTRSMDLHKYIAIINDIINLRFYVNDDYKGLIDYCNFISEFLNDDIRPDKIESILNQNKYIPFIYMAGGSNDLSAIRFSILRCIEYDYFMLNEQHKKLFDRIIKFYVRPRMYELIINSLQYNNLMGTFKEPDNTVVDEQIEKAEIDMDTNTGIFAVGVTTIDKMNTITMEITSDNLERMSSVIVNLKSAVEKYKKYSTIGFWGKIFKSDIEIKANITIAVIDFENLLDKGSNLVTVLSNQYESFAKLYDSLKDLHTQFDEDIKLLESYMQDDQYSDSDKQRLLRRKNDLLAAQTLSRTTAMQYELAKNNIGILIDKFTAIEKILKPAIEMNMKINNDEFNKVYKLL